MTQLALELEQPAENPNAWMYHPDGTPKMLMWPGDDVRIMHQRKGRYSYLVPDAERVLYGVCTDRCPVCNPERYRCAFGCCPPIAEAA